MTDLDVGLAGRFARLTLGHIGQEYPHKLDHVMICEADVLSPSALHPIFHGSFDWHSCVHSWWQMLRLARLFPDMPEAADIRGRADIMLTSEKVAGELAYLARPGSAGFSRPYGWAWLLTLHREAMKHDTPWGPALTPLANTFAKRFTDFLPKLTYPLRVGTHFNTAFALLHAHLWASDYDVELAAMIVERAHDWFGGDRDNQVWEPAGDEFLSPALSVAALMSHLLGREPFKQWLATALPRLAESEPATLFIPAFVSDRSDGKIAHLDGLNLSRAC